MTAINESAASCVLTAARGNLELPRANYLELSDRAIWRYLELPRIIQVMRKLELTAVELIGPN